MRRNSRRWFGIGASVLVGAAMLVGGATPAGAAATPTIAVYPGTPLTDGQKVLVIGTAFDPAAPVTVQECIGENYDCIPVPFAGSVRADGLLVGMTTVERDLPYDGGPNDCAVYHCGLMVSQSTAGTAFTSLHFAPAVVTITPSANLRDGQAVAVVGTNLIPGQRVGLAECQGYGSLCIQRLDAVGTTVVGPDGTVRLRTRPTRFHPDYMDPNELGDCAVATCSLAITLNSQVWEDGYEAVAVAPVRYAPIPAIGAVPTGAQEPDTGTVPVTMDFTEAVGATSPRVVQYRTRPGSASSGSDYVPATGTVVLPAGAVSGRITVFVRGDVQPEADETFFVELRGVGSFPTRPLRVPVGIVNDDVGLAGGLTGRYATDLDDSGTHTAGDEVTWTATVTNTGATPTAKNVALTVWLCTAIRGVVPPVWTASSWTTTRGTTAKVTGSDGCAGIKATIGTLPFGATATVTVTSALLDVPPITIPAAIAYAQFSSSNAGAVTVPYGIPGAVIVNQERAADRRAAIRAVS